MPCQCPLAASLTLTVEASGRVAEVRAETNVVCVPYMPVLLLCRYLEMKEKDQQKAVELIDSDPGLHDLRHLRAPYLDLEVGGIGLGMALWEVCCPGCA